MTKAEHGLMISLALIVRSMSPPDSQREIDRKLEAMQAEADEARAKSDAWLVAKIGQLPHD